MRMVQRPDRIRQPVEFRLDRLPLHEGRHLGIIRRPFVDLPLRQPGHRPALAAIRRPPDPRAAPLSTASGPEMPGLRIADDVVDRPAVAMRAGQAPARAARAGQQEGTLGGADQDGGGFAHVRISSPPRLPADHPAINIKLISTYLRRVPAHGLRPTASVSTSMAQRVGTVGQQRGSFGPGMVVVISTCPAVNSGSRGSCP